MSQSSQISGAKQDCPELVFGWEPTKQVLGCSTWSDMWDFGLGFNLDPCKAFCRQDPDVWEWGEVIMNWGKTYSSYLWSSGSRNRQTKNREHCWVYWVSESEKNLHLSQLLKGNYITFPSFLLVPACPSCSNPTSLMAKLLKLHLDMCSQLGSLCSCWPSFAFCLLNVLFPHPGWHSLC